MRPSAFLLAGKLDQQVHVANAQVRAGIAIQFLPSRTETVTGICRSRNGDGFVDLVDRSAPELGMAVTLDLPELILDETKR